MKLRLVVVTCLAVFGPACGASEAGHTKGAGGSAGSRPSAAAGSPSGDAGTFAVGQGGASNIVGTGGVGTAGSSGPANGGARNGGASASAGLGASASGAAGAASARGGASGSGTSGAPASAGGNVNAAGEPGAAGEIGAAGAGDRGDGLVDGAYELALEVTYGTQSSPVTQCLDNSGQATMVEYADGSRGGALGCWPADDGTLKVHSIGLTFYPDYVGQHDASDLRVTCDLSVGHCEGASVTVVFEVADAMPWEVDSFNTTDKSGTFTLDEFTDDGHVSGSLDLTMSEGGYEVSVKGHFAAHLHDCGPDANGQEGSCLGRNN